MSNASSVTAVLVFQTHELRPEGEPLASEFLRRCRLIYPDVPIFSNRSYRHMKLVEGNDAADCLCRALEATGRSDQDSAAIFFDFSPLLDCDLAREVQASHFNYLAHYTYSENVPPGLVPDFASLEFVRLLGAERPPDLRDFVYKNINRYDVEVFYRLPDLRHYRLDFTLASSRSACLARSTLELAPHVRFEDLHELLLDHPEILRPFPSYFEIELSTSFSGEPDFLPRRESKATVFLERALWEKLAAEIDALGLHGDGTASLAGLGEPLLHPDIVEILERFLALPQIARVYLETRGERFDAAFTERIVDLPGIEKLHVIFRLLTQKPRRYQKLHGADDFERVMGNIARVEAQDASRRPFSAHVEMLKIKEVEDEITEFFDRFEKSPVQPILQKFNSYALTLPERRVSDLTPLCREYCRHLARDLYLTAEGLIPLCKQDPFALRSAFDFRELSLAEVLIRTLGAHKASVRGEHRQIPMPCLDCDEWYTFNG